MKTSESEEGSSAHNRMIHPGKPTQVWVYIGKKSIVEYPTVKINYLTNKKGVISELVY